MWKIESRKIKIKNFNHLDIFKCCLNYSCVKQDTEMDSTESLENENKNSRYQKLCDLSKTIFIEKLIGLGTYTY